MTVIIEISSEVAGVSATKRAILSSENHKTAEDLEAAVIEFVRVARIANEETLASYVPSSLAEAN